ncbi:unnamed protein product [Soboliphyme baturini]|uniref:peptidylprolyl isomerase n=1 Tax=Soboliphyme baturini TaxID=241478 RepID=A0A183IP53_9BILA|nr:unnamed protein product [Soboliphyme baturini]
MRIPCEVLLVWWLILFGGSICQQPYLTVVDGQQIPLKSVEDSIPVIEIRAEGKPMTSAQIRALEEAAEGKPLDVKVKRITAPKNCQKKAKRKDFVTFHYVGMLENGRRFADTYKTGPCRIQFKVGMTVPGLDKGMTGMCENEQRRIKVPWRLLQSKRGKVWRKIPKSEHWLIFDVKMLKVERWTPEAQFHFMDMNNDSLLTQPEIVQHVKVLEEEYGKHWPSADIDTELAARYFIQYFDANNDDRVERLEYVERMEKDLTIVKKKQSNVKGRRRDPDVMWILDFDADGIVSVEEIGKAAQVIERGYQPTDEKPTRERTEL